MPPEGYRELDQEHPSNPQDEEKDALITGHPSRRRPYTNYLPFVLSLFLTLSLFLNVITLVSNHSQDLDALCSLHTSQSRSPMSEDIKITYSTRQFNGSFMEPSPYTADPSVEVDENWLALGSQARHFRVPEDRASYYGLDPGHAQYHPGGGYPVLFEFEHHLHCVNLLRQSLHWNFNYYSARGEGPFSNAPEVVKTHVNHCVDILRQVIMCQPDTGVFGQYWVEEIEQPFVDFRTDHKCKNVDDMIGWVLEHQVTEEFAKTAKVVPGDVILEHVP